VVVVGSGAAGLAAAVTAAHAGARALVLERAEWCGGATARSGGWAWTPGTSFAQQAGVTDNAEDFKAYLRAVLGENYESERIDAFMQATPEMVDFFHNQTALEFVPGAWISDIYGHLPSAGTGYRSVGPAPINARRLSKTTRSLLPPQYYETSFLGLGIMAGPDLSRFLAASRGEMKGLLHATRRVGLHMLDLLLHRRGWQLVNGLALVARLVESALAAGVEIRTRARVTALIGNAESGVCGVGVRINGVEQQITARRGVVLATGGFPQNADLRRDLFPRVPTGKEHWTLAPPEADGAGLRLARQVGGELRADLAAPAAWCPVSLVPYRNGRQGLFPHIMDRAKPGSIGVLSTGRRFVNEANGYHDYVTALIASAPEGELVQSWQIADSRFVRRYPFGMAKPRPVPLFPYLRSGYLIRGRTIRVLAQRCGIDPAGLEATVEQFNKNAAAGVDPEFGRGESSFNRLGGDPTVGPNPSLAPLDKPPFYAVRILPGSFGTFAGVATDAHARVVSGDGTPIRGLYAAGSDQANVMGGHYPAGGINIGPALTFGYLAGRHITR
jgi:succinate dehydrogenase/fumarate reductase flavoprotein subunit